MLVQLVDGAARLTIVTPSDADLTASDLAAAQVTGFQNDPDTTWIVGDLTAFTTDAGDTGYYVVGHSPTDVLQAWSVDLDDGSVVSFVGQAPDTVWNDVAADMDSMVYSFVHTPGAGP